MLFSCVLGYVCHICLLKILFVYSYNLIYFLKGFKLIYKNNGKIQTLKKIGLRKRGIRTRVKIRNKVGHIEIAVLCIKI